MTAQEAFEAVLAGQTLRLVVGDGDPTLHVFRDEGLIIQQGVAGWSEGVVEVVCSVGSPFTYEYLAEHVDKGNTIEVIR